MSKEELDGVWRTVRGRRIFIKKGESLGEAMSRSGKFNKKLSNPKKEDYDAVEKRFGKEARSRVEKYFDKYGREDRKEAQREEIERVKKEYEYELYKRAKERPETIDAMTENSTDWEALEEKYGKTYSLEKEQQKKYDTAKKYIEKKKSNNKVAVEIKDNKATRNENAQAKKYNEYNKNEEQYREKISREIAKELNASLKNASENRLQKEAGNIRSYADGEVLEKGEKPYSNIYGGLERSTKSLEEWLKRLRKGK